MFSPMVAIASEMAVSTVTLPILAALIFSTSAPTSSATCAIILTNPWKCSLRATKSVSELTSTTTPLVPAVSAPISPSAATRPAFLAAFDSPFLRSQSIDACMSPLFSVRAALQSIMPAPVVSRRSLTIAAVIVVIVCMSSACQGGSGAVQRSAGTHHQQCRKIEIADRNIPAGPSLFRFRDKDLGLGHPAIGPARKPNLFADMVGGVVIELGELPIVENAEIVELLLDRAGHAGELLQIVGSATRPGKTLEAQSLRCGRYLLARGMRGSADIDPGFALRARNAVDCRTGDKIAVKRDRTAGVVIAGHDVGDALGIGIGINDGGDGNVEPLGFLDRDVFLVGVDHEDHVGQAAHLLDATERTVELVALALQGQPFLFGIGTGIAGIEHLIEVPQPLDRA